MRSTERFRGIRSVLKESIFLRSFCDAARFDRGLIKCDHLTFIKMVLHVTTAIFCRNSSFKGNRVFSWFPRDTDLRITFERLIRSCSLFPETLMKRSAKRRFHCSFPRGRWFSSYQRIYIESREIEVRSGSFSSPSSKTVGPIG